MSTLTIIFSMLGMLLLAMILAVLFWWLRTQSGLAIRSFYAAVRKMETEQGMASRYQVPWLMLLGDPREGNQLCFDWQLTPIGRPGWFGRWWSDQDGAVLVVPQNIFLPSDSSSVSTFVWRRLLNMLVRLRGQRPLDGVIWNIPLGLLQNSAQSVADVVILRRRFSDLLQRVGLELPVYVLITGLEEMPGFQELIDVLPEEGLEQLLGWSSVYGLDTGWQGYWIDDALHSVVQSVQAAIIEVGALKGEWAEDLYRLPDFLLALKPNLHGLLEPVFQGNSQGEALKLRGLYFGATQAYEQPDTELLYPGERPPTQGVFTHLLWQRRLLAEQGLAKALPRVLDLRRRWQKTVGGIAAGLALCWLLGMIWVWQARLHDASQLSALLKNAHTAHVSLQNPERRKEQTRSNVQGFWMLMQQAPRWSFSSFLYPTSWGASLDTRMLSLLRGMALREALVPLQQLQAYELRELLSIRNEQRRPDVENGPPDQWPNYVKARTLAQGVVDIERHNFLLNEALNGQDSFIESLAQLSDDMLGLKVDPSSLTGKDFYNRVLQGMGAFNLKSVDLTIYREQLARQFRGLIDFWLAQYFLAGSFSTPAGYLKKSLIELEDGGEVSLVKLEEISALIERLEELIILANSAWDHGSGDELAPGYRDLMSIVKQSQLLGLDVEAGITREANKLRKGFQTQWIGGGAGRDGLLRRKADGTLILQDHVLKLSRSIDALLAQEFSVVAIRNLDSTVNYSYLPKLTESHLAQALVYEKSYQDYVAQELVQISPIYRSSMIKIAEKAAVLAMWSALTSSTAVANAPSYSVSQFNISIEKAVEVVRALVALGRADLGGLVQSQLTMRATADIDAVLAGIERMPLFIERYQISEWDGVPGLGLKLFRAADVQDLKGALSQQFVEIGNSLEKIKPELEWLSAQANLPTALNGRVLRLIAIMDEMQQYKAQSPSSSPVLLEQLVGRDLVDLNVDNCHQVLKAAILPQGEDDLARYARRITDQTYRRCAQLQVQDAVQAWSALANYFNQYLAGRFPFSYSLEDIDADPNRVKYFLELIDDHLEVAEKGLALAPPGDRLAAEDFLEGVKQAKSWLGPMFIRDKSGATGLELEIRWRTDREDERGADQVITWTMRGAARQINYPSESGQRLQWNVGDPLQLVLRWARDSNQRPDIDPLQPSMAVNDLEAGWEYRGPWALLRMIRSHVVPRRLPNMDYTDFPLTLRIPLQRAPIADSQALMFIRLSLLSTGSNLPLSIKPLPVAAPSSPFAGLHLQALQDGVVMQ